MADVGFNWTSDPSKVLEDMKKVVDGLKQVGDGAKKTAKESRDTQKRGGDGAKDWAKGLGGVVAQYALIRESVRAVNDLMRENARLESEAAARLKGSEIGLAKLAQLAGGDMTRFGSLQEAGKRFFGMGGAENLNAAYNAVYALESAGQLRHADVIAKLFPIIYDPAMAAKSGTSLIQSMGEKETGALPDVVAKSFIMARYGASEPDELLQAQSTAGTFGRALGLSDEDVGALVTALDKTNRSAEIAGTQARAVLEAAVKRGITGKSVEEIVNKLEGEKGLENTARAAMLTFKTPEGRDVFDITRQGLYDVAGSDIIGQTAEIIGATPELAARRASRLGASRKELVEQGGGIARTVREAQTDRFVSNVRAKSGVAGAYASFMTRKIEGMGAGGMLDRIYGLAPEGSAGFIPPEERARTESAVMRVEEQNKRVMESLVEVMTPMKDSILRQEAANTGTKQIPRTSHSE